MGAHEPQGPAGEEQGAPRSLRRPGEEEQKADATGHEILIPPAPRMGDEVVIAKKLSKSYGDKLLFDNMNFSLPRSGIVGVIGPNGAGKTTLFRMIVGQEKPDGGELIVGQTVQTAYVDQSREALDPNKTAYEEIAGGLDTLQFGTRSINSRAYCGWFGFRGTDQQKKTGLLSAVNAIACTSPSFSRPAATCSCSTNRPTTSTSTRCGRSRTRS